MLTIFNWKANPARPSEADRLFRATAAAAFPKDVLIAPPQAYLSVCAAASKALRAAGKSSCGIAAQDCVPDGMMPLTGSTNTAMLRALGIRYAIIGHSERRMKLGETEGLIGAKMRGILAQGITPILCVGETKRSNPASAMRLIARQLARGFEGIENSSVKSPIIAYEPVWAIGGHQEVDAGYAVDVIARIKQWCGSNLPMPLRVLYGGSVNSRTVESLVRYGDVVDGFLVGSASLLPSEVKILIKKIYG